MELLAPAGSLAAFEVAIAEGADAVYVGAPGCNARALRRDFSLAEIAAMVDYAHERGRKLYVAMNSLVKQEEIPEVVDTLEFLDAIRPDALIVQDFGLIHIVRRFFPELPLHASTLMAIHNVQGAEFFAQLGFERVVLARELAVTDIRKISRKSGIGVEVFIHGALCFSFSGLCLFSSLHGGKSSLRGQCVQPCRRKYSLDTGKTSGRSKIKSKGSSEGYLFSMNDLCGIDYLDDLYAAGVESLKIEGRLRPVEYVRKTVRAYRLCLDHLDAPDVERKRAWKKARTLLDQDMGRKQSPGYFGGVSSTLIQPHLAGGAGLFLGKASVQAIKGKAQGKASCMVTLQHELVKGDRLRFQSTKGDIRETFTVRDILYKNHSVKKGDKGQNVILPFPVSTHGIKTLQGVLFKVDVQKRREREAKSKITSAGRKISADLRRSAGISAFFSGSEIPEPQRRAQPEWWIRLRDLPAVKQRYPVKPARIVLPLSDRNLQHVERLKGRAIELYPNKVWALPPLIKEESVKFYGHWIKLLIDYGYTSFQLGHVSQTVYFPNNQEGSLELYADYTANPLNAAALVSSDESGLSGVLFSLETDRQNLQKTCWAWEKYRLQMKSSRMRIGAYVYGRPPLFTSMAELPHLKARKRIVSPRGEYFQIQQQGDQVSVYSAVPLSLLSHIHEMQSLGVSYFVLDLSYGAFERAVSELALCLRNHGSVEQNTGNYLGGLV